ncbi:ATPase family AAA domain-containing protein 2-like [Onthophagus taurus]|uniref:ATPase family AAA domain-containing protein 2-like n=1 Tax=Onthophagus taurus TaxID=166361 RepID=UPI000C20D4C8|nr:ATPase family AAA domain-containing protein 2-like [Onthophagus taurus]
MKRVGDINQQVTAQDTNRRLCLRNSNTLPDFSKVGGLSTHIQLLREIIIFPLLYEDLYKHFCVKAPRGVLFYGPPGTGKTLVAGALSTELSRVGNGKVTFYQRKGADILDKWFGESERKLSELFLQANKTRPSIIFFDELDGLAPVRCQQNDQNHCSIVATLLTLMDGLDNKPGVVVIGATNRIDALDPALRRPGRFDREIYFPLPSVNARKEILQVHTYSWTYKPSNELLYKIAESTSGCCGSDLQALCAEAVLCSLKREYPDVHKPRLIGTKMKINIYNLVVQEIDFLNARMNLVPTAQRLGNYRARKLSPFIKPLLQRQLDKIIKYINILLPQFTQPFKKFLIGNERYVGRLVLKGSNQQGLIVHIIPAILQFLEHIPCYMLDIPALFETNIKNARQNLPSILVLSRVDDWWDMIESSIQLSLTTMLEDLHPGIPLLLIATCNEELPLMLQNYFYNNSSIVIKIDDPNVEERENFFAPLFFGNSETSVATILKKETPNENIKETIPIQKCKREIGVRHKKHQICLKDISHKCNNLKRKSNRCHQNVHIKKRKIDRFSDDLEANYKCKCKKAFSTTSTIIEHRSDITSLDSRCSLTDLNKNRGRSKNIKNTTLIDMIDCSVFQDENFIGKIPSRVASEGSVGTFLETIVKKEPKSFFEFESTTKLCQDLNNPKTVDIFNLWKRTAHETSANLPVGQLEMLYDIIAACIVVNKHKYHGFIETLEKTLNNFERSTKSYAE